MKTVFFLSFFIYSSALFSQIPITSELIDCMSGKKVKGYVCLCERNDFGNLQYVSLISTSDEYDIIEIEWDELGFLESASNKNNVFEFYSEGRILRHYYRSDDDSIQIEKNYRLDDDGKHYLYTTMLTSQGKTECIGNGCSE